MIDSLYIALRYVRFHKMKTLILVSVITLTLFLPIGVNTLVDEGARQLNLRAEQTPILVGAKGSEADLVLNSLYFESKPPATTSMAEVQRIQKSKFAVAIPLYTRFKAKGRPIVGTTLDYFEFRNLEIEEGRPFAMLGECVLGAEIAKSLQLSPGDSLISDSENVFDLASTYPLKMHVVGVFEPTGSPDDSAVFVDVKTAWIIAGLGHGHQELSEPEQGDSILKQESDHLTANASVLTFTEITPKNASSFHFHGDMDSFPLSGVIAVPWDQKSETLLKGRYQGADEKSQIVAPDKVMGELLATVLRVRALIIAGSLLLGVASMLSVILVFMLSLRLRRNELETMSKIGASQFRLITIVAWELILVIGSSCAIAFGMTILSRRFGEHFVQWFLF